MKVETIIKELDLEFPQTFAMDWDNPGLQVGSSQKEVKKVLVALDATNEVIEECIAWHADLLLTHHPLLLSGIRQINDGSMHGRKVLMLAEHGIAHYAMHTNYDVAKMAELAGARGADRLRGRCTVRNRLHWRVWNGTDSTGMLSSCERSVSASTCKAVWRKGNEDKKSGGLPWIRKEHDR